MNLIKPFVWFKQKTKKEVRSLSLAMHCQLVFYFMKNNIFSRDSKTTFVMIYVLKILCYQHDERLDLCSLIQSLHACSEVL